MNTNLTTAQLFDQLNTFRVRNGKSPLKAFKESRAKLEALVSAEGAKAHPEFEMPKDELNAQTIRPVPLPQDQVDAAVTTNVGTAQPEKAKRLKTQRKEHEAVTSKLEEMEKTQPSESLKETIVKKLKAVTKAAKSAKKQKPAKADRKQPANHSSDEVAEYIRAQGNPKVIRARLRAAGLSAPYSLADVKKALKK